MPRLMLFFRMTGQLRHLVAACACPSYTLLSFSHNLLHLHFPLVYIHLSCFQAVAPYGLAGRVLVGACALVDVAVAPGHRTGVHGAVPPADEAHAGGSRDAAAHVV